MFRIDTNNASTAAHRCTADHSGILSGMAHNLLTSNGFFFAKLPVGAEVTSISGRRCRWTGQFADRHGHDAALLQVLDVKGKAAGLREIAIHSCLDSHAWNATGWLIDEDGTRIERIWPSRVEQIRAEREAQNA